MVTLKLCSVPGLKHYHHSEMQLAREKYEDQVLWFVSTQIERSLCSLFTSFYLCAAICASKTLDICSLF